MPFLAYWIVTTPTYFHFQIVNLEPIANWQVDNFIIHYKCPRKGYPIEINKLSPKACHHILHLSNCSPNTNIMKWTHLLCNTLNECKPQWGEKKIHMPKHRNSWQKMFYHKS
jgi:hypothetical protein